jgi:LPS sulfotransferase NodH
MAKQYVICATPRTGSNLLCDYLINAGILGKPGEFFNSEVIQLEYYGKMRLPPKTLSVERYIQWLKANFCSANGVFGFKILYYHFEQFRFFPAFRQLFNESRVVWLTRRSKIRQAVSYHIALSTDHWAPKDEARKPLGAGRLIFDFEKINARLRELTEVDQAWLTAFACLGLDYKTVVYEDFIQDPRHFLGELAGEMGLWTWNLKVASDWTKQHERTSDEFFEKYVERMREELNSDKAHREYEGISITP